MSLQRRTVRSDRATGHQSGSEPIPNAIYESITMVVRARGSDLADFRAGRLTREEMLKRVEVRGF